MNPLRSVGARLGLGLAVVVALGLCGAYGLADRDPQLITLGAKLSRDHELIYPPIQEFWDAAVSGTS